MRKSKRLNVTESRASHADVNHISGEQSLPQVEPVLQTEGLADDNNRIEQEDDVDIHMSDEDDDVRTRGPTTLPYLWDLPTSKRIVVKCNNHGQPIGREGGILGQFLGTIASMSKFLYPRSCEPWILKSIGRDWRQYKATLKKTLFDPKKKKSVLRKRCPDDVDEEQWKKLIKQWKSKKGKALSEKNKGSRAKRKTSHTTGTKSYARWVEDIRQNDPEKKHPHRSQVYLATHKDKRNNRDHHVDELQNLIDDHPELAENVKGSVAWKGDALHKVLGEEKPGQVHGMGLLPVPKQVYGWTSHHLKNINITTTDGPSSVVDIEIMEKMEKLEEHNKNQDKLIQELLSKQTCTCNGTGETSELDLQPVPSDRFQPHSIHSKRKRVECNVTNQDRLLSEQEALRHKESHDGDNIEVDDNIFNKKRQHMDSNRKDIPCPEKESRFAPDFPHEKNKKQKQQQDATYKRQDQVGTTVMLTSINKVNLAFATLLSCDPDAQVGGIRLGNQFWKVRVNYPLEEKEELIRPWGQYKTIGDAKGKYIAWPSVFVEKVNGR